MFLFVAGFLIYCIMAFLSYNNTFKVWNSAYFYTVGIVLAIIVNLIWLTIVREERNESQLLFKGLVWDSMIVIAYLAVPLILMGVRLTLIQSIGVGLVVLGLVLTKFGGT